MTKNEFKLTGGILLNLLKKIAHPSITPAEKLAGKKSKLSEPALCAALIEVFTGIAPIYDSTESFGKDVSKYKTCQFNGGSNVPFNKEENKNSLKSTIETNFSKVRERTLMFINRCIVDSEQKQQWFVKACLDFLISNESNNGRLFYVLEDGTPISFEQLKQLKTFEFASFIVGMLYHIAVYETDNSAGRTTFEFLTTDTNNGVIGNNSAEICVFTTPQHQPTYEAAEQDADDYHQPDAQPNEVTVQQVINHQTVVNQYGPKNTYIAHVEVLKL